jgi:hypothetical protein
MFAEAILFIKCPQPISFNDKCLMVEQPYKLDIEAQDHLRALAGAPVGMPSLCQLPSGPSLKIDLQTHKAVGLGICLMLLNQISDISYTPKHT